MNELWNEEYKKTWDRRYKKTEFAYGQEPNLFFKEWIEKFKPGSVLMPAEGEGRNGVYAAELKWEVTAFDLSMEGKAKALTLAAQKDVSIEYIVGNLDQITFEKESFDVIGLIYAHFAADRKSTFHRKLHGYLKPGGIIIMEAFSKGHLSYVVADPKVGGPKDIDMLYEIEEVKSDFSDYEYLVLEEKEIILDEGVYHRGRGSVIRFVGRKL